MKKLIAMLFVFTMASASAFAMNCIPLMGQEQFQPVSSTEILVTDASNTQYQVTVAECPELMYGQPIVVAPSDNELCEADSISVGGDVCPIQSITQVSHR